jgi:hypothetical protein
VVSPAPPRVRLLAPIGGKNFASGGALAVSWQAEDPDGDVLTCWPQYSADDGRMWTNVFRDLINRPAAALVAYVRAGHVGSLYCGIALADHESGQFDAESADGDAAVKETS